ncbi:MAG: ComF family protein [Chloroflexi bacterium]|nr:ComF family protein [Chloroflexota bacterium]
MSVPLVAATGLHSDILREAVQGLKYGNVQVLAAALGARLARRLQMQNWTIDMLIPVPLHAARLRERGYNQAQMVCEAAARQLALPCVPEALRRERYTHSQVGLTRAERMRNVVDAFSADPDRVSQRTIVVVDDVCTTGSTLSACAQALLAAGARMVYGLTVTVARDTNIVSHYTQGVGHGDQNSRS